MLKVIDWFVPFRQILKQNIIL